MIGLPLLMAMLGLAAPADDVAPSTNIKVHEIDEAWAGHPVGFDLLTGMGKQFIAYYDADRVMTIASRDVGADTWAHARLPSKVGWDSHNSITMALDDDGFLHVVGNMHVSPLVYFRSERPRDASSFETLHRMVGANEERTTYPRFFRGPDNALMFMYRDGKSGDGNQVFNVYDLKSRTWKRLLDQPLTDGQGLRNAYLAGPTLGPDGLFHVVWVWRETPDCATNHDLSYARSRDLVHWENANGDALTLPIRLGPETIIDAVPEHGGLINGCQHLGFDAENRPVIAYHKFDDRGLTQCFTARFEDGRWATRQASDWSYRWDFSGGGSIGFEIHLSAPTLRGDVMTIGFTHPKQGRGTIRLDAKTLEPTTAKAEEVASAPRSIRSKPWPSGLSRVGSSFPEMQARTLEGRGEDGGRYLLRWETLPPNRDRPRQPPWPGPSKLRLYERIGP
jgi:hypothetical protein